MSRICLACVVSAFLMTPLRAEDWPQFRGPGGQGHSNELGLAIKWSEKENIAWKTPIPGLGWSSPVIRGDRIWLTTATDDGRSLRAVSVDKTSGKLLVDVEVFRDEQPPSIQSKNSHASPSAILDGDRVYVHFGPRGTAALSAADGKVLWKKKLDYDPVHGPGGSPALYGDSLFISCDGGETQYIVALDKNTGDVRWKRSREGSRHSYSTPLVIEVAGEPQVISTGGDHVYAYDPRSGDDLWVSRYDGYSLVPRPVFGHGLVFIASGYNTPNVYAIRPDGSGDVTDTHVAWTLTQGAPHNPSPLVVGDELYLVADNGVATCLDAKTGRVHWRQRLGGGFSASPVFADGRIYFLNETGETTVVAPGTKYEELTKNQLPGRTLASLAVSAGAIFLRTDTHLYRIESGAK